VPSDPPDISVQTRGEQTPLPLRRVSAIDLLQGRREIIIEHQGQEYRLRVTAADKLILTK
jgi:hemin uptake protein HemP